MLQIQTETLWNGLPINNHGIIEGMKQELKLEVRYSSPTAIADVYGNGGNAWAVHGEPSDWIVSHALSGLRVHQFRLKRQAIHVAKELNEVAISIDAANASFVEIVGQQLKQLIKEIKHEEAVV